MPLAGVEPTAAVPETAVLSIKLQGLVLLTLFDFAVSHYTYSMPDPKPHGDPRLLGAEKRLPALQNSLESARREILDKYPTARVIVGLKSLEDPKLAVEVGSMDEEVFLASLAKLCWIVSAIKIAESRYGEDALSASIPVHLNERMLSSLYDYLNSGARGVEIDALVSELIGPSVAADGMDNYSLVELLELEGIRRSVEESNAVDLERQIQEKLANAPVVFTDVSLEDLVRVTLGPSSNESILVIKSWLASEFNIENPANYVQEQMDRLLETDGFAPEDLRLSITGSTLHKDRSGKNTGRLSEITAVYRMVAESDARLDLSERSVAIVKEAMKVPYDARIDIQAQLQELGHEVWGKIGWFPDLDTDYLQELANKNHWDSIAVHHLSNVLVIDGKWLVAFSFAREIDDQNERERPEGEQMERVRNDVEPIVEAISDWLKGSTIN